MEFETFQKLALLFHEKGYELYLVGGSVRDYLLYSTIFDVDVVTDAPLKEIKSFLKFVKEFPMMESGTILFDDVLIDITRMRKESDYDDYRHPRVIIPTSDIKEDAIRRDFTCNALYLNDNKELIDPFNGKNDIDNKILKTIGDPYIRLKEDPLRILRAIRLSYTHRFEIEGNLLKAILDLKHLLKKLNYQKIEEELSKFKIDEGSVRKVLHQYGIDQVIPIYYEHKERIIFDLYNNSFSQIYEEYLSKGISNFCKELNNMQKNSYLGQVFYLSITLKGIKDRYEYLLNEINFYHEIIKDNYFFIEEAYSSIDFIKIKNKGKRIALLAIEEDRILENNINRIDELYKLGVRIIKIKSDEFFDENQKLNEFGLKAIKHMNELGVIIDASGFENNKIEEIINNSSKPIIAFNYDIKDGINSKNVIMGFKNQQKLMSYILNDDPEKISKYFFDNENYLKNYLICFESFLLNQDANGKALKWIEYLFSKKEIERIGYKNFLNVWKDNENC